MPAYRGRLAPSPTGRLHLGHVRTFLVAWLRARQADGTLVLRMEDLDTPRLSPGAAEAILRDLRWLGFDWDEGPDVGGPSGPYVQSERSALYAEAARKLERRGLVYPCTCSRKDIQEASAPHGVEGLGLRYPGTCREVPSHPDRPAALRFIMPEPPPPLVDGLRGKVDVGAWGGDFVIHRADGLWAYQLAVVVDDAAMGITEVVRGDDLLPSTPRQVALYEALDLEPPAFFHVPLVLGPDGARLSKRHGAAAIEELRERGLDAAEVIGLVAHSLGLVGSREPLSPRDLVEADLTRIPRSPVVQPSLNESR